MKLFILGTRNSDKDSIAGWIQSSELIDQFDPKTWFPLYQRDRVTMKRKINELKATVLKGGSFPAVVVNLVGTVRKVTDGYNFEGDLHIIDGQQRTMALIESGKRDYLLLVQAHVDLPYVEEVKKFQDLNTKGTKLPFGYLIRSICGPAADLVRRFAKKNTSGLPVSVNDRKLGITLGWLAPIIHILYKKLVDRAVRIKYGNPHELSKFLADQRTENRLSVVEFATRNVLCEYARIFGSFDCRSMAYSRSVFMSVTLVMIHNFITKEGKLDYRGFKSKMTHASKDFLNNSYLRELITAGGNSGGSEMIYEEFVKYLNRGMQERNRLPNMSALREIADGHKKIQEITGDLSSDALVVEANSPQNEEEDDNDHQSGMSEENMAVL